MENNKRKEVLGIILAFIVMFLIQFVAAIIVVAIDIAQGGAISLVVDDALPIELILAMSLVSGVLSALIFGCWHYKRTPDLNGPKASIIFKNKIFIWIIGLGIGLQILISGVLEGVSKIFPDVATNYAKHMENLGIGEFYIMSTIMVVILAPLWEEFFFRGIIYKKAKNIIPIRSANVFQAVIFGLIHGNIIQGLYAFVIGIVLGKVYEEYKTIALPIAIHFVINLSGILLAGLGDILDNAFGVTANSMVIVTGVLVAISIPLTYISMKKLMEASV